MNWACLMIEFCCCNLAASLTIIFMSSGFFMGCALRIVICFYFFLSLFWGKILLVLKGGLCFFCAFKCRCWSVRPSLVFSQYLCVQLKLRLQGYRKSLCQSIQHSYKESKDCVNGDILPLTCYKSAVTGLLQFHLIPPLIQRCGGRAQKPLF